MDKIAVCLWFDGKAEEAVSFYTSVFKRSKSGEVLRWGDVGPGPKGSVLTIEFELEGRNFLALNGGPQYSFTPAISLSVDCATQAEVDELWQKLLADGGKEMACGWLTDRFGVSWQIVPSILPKMLRDPDPTKAGRVMEAMMNMIKLDFAGLQRAYDGG
jgi:predicted 3-demethylubiquinone-9 3-methyltransferase (glyoxalase superfamily)